MGVYLESSISGANLEIHLAIRSESKLDIVSGSNEGVAYAYSAFVTNVGLCIGIRRL